MGSPRTQKAVNSRGVLVSSVTFDPAQRDAGHEVRLGFLAMTVRVEAATGATSELQSALARLLPQLYSQLPVPTADRVQAIVADPAVTLLLAKEGDAIVGTATVVVYPTPFWIKARLDDVVVDEAARGKGVGEALVDACLKVARTRGA